MEADRMVNCFIARKDLDSEFSVVRNEMESGENNPFRILMQKMQSAAYQWHSYGKNTIGARSDVDAWLGTVFRKFVGLNCALYTPRPTSAHGHRNT